MLRKLSVALAAGVAAVGFVSLATSASVAAATETSTWKPEHFNLEAKCKIDDEKALLVVENKSDKEVDFALIKKRDGDDGPSDMLTDTEMSSRDAIKGEVKAHDKKFVKVPFKSEHDTWLLFIKKEKEPTDAQDSTWEWKFVDKVTVGKLKSCFFDIKTVCKVDDHTVKMEIINKSPWDASFKLEQKDDDFETTGTVEKKDSVHVKVPFRSEDDKWLLTIKPDVDHEDGSDASEAASWGGDLKKIGKTTIKHRVGPVEPCEKPTPKPTEKPELPVTGSSTLSFMGVGLGLFSLGAVLLLLARRRRGIG